MKSSLSPSLLSDLNQISEICGRMGADLVLIGATAVLIQLGELGRITRDIDLTVALDLDDFRKLGNVLNSHGWSRVPRQEHRWIAPGRTTVDLLPAGTGLRRDGRILWPESELEMSLAGFNHVFSDAVTIELAADTQIRVASLPVVTLLKMIAYLDSPYRRAKDLDDIRLLLRCYLHDSPRLFSDEVFDAGLEDFCLANAWLLGLDMKRLSGERQHVNRFLSRFAEEEESPFTNGLAAFSKGFQIK